MRSPYSLKKEGQTVKQGGASGKVLVGSGEKKENLLVVAAAADECEPLAYKPKPVSTRLLYFCRPPRTRSKRTPDKDRQQAGLFISSQFLVLCREAEEQQQLQRGGPTLPHHPSLQTLAEAAGLARFPPPLGDLALVHHGAAVLNVA